jgi:hypothetical protein
MRKILLGLGLLAIFILAYTLGFSFRNYPIVHRQAIVFTPNTEQTLPQPRPKEQAKSNEPAQGKQLDASRKDLAEAIRNTRGAELVGALRALPHVSFSRIQDSLRNRFSSEYPKGEYEQLKEISSRTSILSALSSYTERMISHTEQQQLTTFLEGISGSKSEPWSVRSRASEVLAKSLGRMEEEQRLEVLAAMANRGLNFSSRQPAEILENIFREKESK